MLGFKSKEIERYWKSLEAVEPIIKHVGLRKRLNLARINSDLQSIVYSWLRRHQEKLIIITGIDECEIMKFIPGHTLMANPNSGHLPLRLLELFPRLSMLSLIHYGDMSTRVNIIDQLGGNFKAVERMESSGFQPIDEMGYKHLMALMDSNPNLK